ncbi:MAG: biopolymer transporter ExbD [Rhodobacteraceae bacterium]|nr:biopolymer transporter ExbD [Paracoccaceae bacterium]
MDIESPRKRPAQESIVPMINVVFLLLIFFLMTSQIAPPDPVDVTAPHSVSGGEPEAEARLFLSTDGMLYFGEATGDSVLQALKADKREEERLLLTADKGVEAQRIAQVLRALAALGVPHVELVVSQE